MTFNRGVIFSYIIISSLNCTSVWMWKLKLQSWMVLTWSSHTFSDTRYLTYLLICIHLLRSCFNTSIAYNSTIAKTLIPNKRCSTTGCCTAKILPSSKDFYALHLSRQPPQTISTFQISHTNTGFGDQSLRWKPTNLGWDATKDIKNLFFFFVFFDLAIRHLLSWFKMHACWYHKSHGQFGT